MHPKLFHLSEEQLQELLRRYYDPEKEFTVSQIIADFEIDVRPGELASLLPETVHQETCPYCQGVNLVSKARSRSTYGQSTPACPNCGHKASQYCSCANCRRAQAVTREVQERLRRQIVYRHFGPDAWPLTSPVGDLSLKDAVYLKAVVIHKATEDLRLVEPTAMTQTQLAPGERMIWDVLKHLYHGARVIAPDPESDLSAFRFTGNDDEGLSFYLDRVEWLLLPRLSQENRRAYLRDVDSRLRSMVVAENMEFAEHQLWHQIVKYEALEYYEHKLAEVNVELDQIGDRTHAVFDDLINRFSLAQIYHIIYVTIRNTHHYITQKRIPRHQAKNMYVGAIERNANKYEVEGWLKEFRRDFNCPQSTLSSVFFDFYLGIGASYFETALPRLPDSNPQY